LLSADTVILEGAAGIANWDLGINPLNAELNPTCYLLALLGAHHIFHVGGLRVKFSIVMSILMVVCG